MHAWPFVKTTTNRVNRCINDNCFVSSHYFCRNQTGARGRRKLSWILGLNEKRIWQPCAAGKMYLFEVCTVYQTEIFDVKLLGMFEPRLTDMLPQAQFCDVYLRTYFFLSNTLVNSVSVIAFKYCTRIRKKIQGTVTEIFISQFKTANTKLRQTLVSHSLLYHSLSYAYFVLKARSTGLQKKLLCIMIIHVNIRCLGTHGQSSN
jgi:hypothetical protein